MTGFDPRRDRPKAPSPVRASLATTVGTVQRDLDRP